MFRIVSGPITTVWAQKKASTAFAYNDAVVFDTDGYLNPATSASTSVFGFIDRAVLSTDSDYASASFVPVVLNTPNTEIEFSVGTGTLATTNQGEFIDLKDAANADATASTTDIIFVKKVVSTTKGIGMIAAPSSLK